MNAGPTSERVYDALKFQLLTGSIPPDAKLEPAALAADLNSSVTPVRDALHQLCGERLVESRHSDGFHLPHVTEPALRDLYSWNAELIRLIVRAWPRAMTEPRADQLPAELHSATRAFFDLIAARSRNIEHAAQIEAASDRLSAARHAEPRVLSGLEAEIRALAVDFDNGPTSALATRLAAYHRRRIVAVPDIVRALYRA